MFERTSVTLSSLLLISQSIISLDHLASLASTMLNMLICKIHELGKFLDDNKIRKKIGTLPMQSMKLLLLTSTLGFSRHFFLLSPTPSFFLFPESHFPKKIFLHCSVSVENLTTFLSKQDFLFLVYFMSSNLNDTSDFSQMFMRIICSGSQDAVSLHD